MKAAKAVKKLIFWFIAVFMFLEIVISMLVFRTLYRANLINVGVFQSNTTHFTADYVSNHIDSTDCFDLVQAYDNNEDMRYAFFIVVTDKNGKIVSPERRMNVTIPDFAPGEKVSEATVDSILYAVQKTHILGSEYNLYSFYSETDATELMSDVELTFFILMGSFFLVAVFLLGVFFVPWISKLLAKKEQTELELNFAHNMQQNEVPTVFPDIPHCSIHAQLNPAHEVGGDLYECYVYENYLYFVMGDVSDKGVPAAFVMYKLMGTCRHYMHKGFTPDDIMNRLNNLLNEDRSSMFCTMFLARINLDTMEMEYTNAGHEATLINGDFLPQDVNIVLGVMPDFAYTLQKVQLPDNCILVQYSDGVVEALNTKEQMFEEARLQQWAKNVNPYLSAKELTESLFKNVRKFAGKAVQNDDIAILCINFNKSN